MVLLHESTLRKLLAYWALRGNFACGTCVALLACAHSHFRFTNCVNAGGPLATMNPCPGRRTRIGVLVAVKGSSRGDLRERDIVLNPVRMLQ